MPTIAHEEAGVAATAKEAMAAALYKLKQGAYVTFLAGSGDYWKGVVGLAKGLRAVKSAYPLVVAVLQDVPEAHRRTLVDQGCIVREIMPVYPPESKTNNKFIMPSYVVTYSKLRIWEFVEYERMVYLDADTQVYDNIDHLLDLEKGSFYAVKDCFCEKPWSHTPQYKMGYCQQCPDRVAWPDGDGVPPPPLYFNSGLFVHEPGLATARALLDRLAVTEPGPFGDQDFLNTFFCDVYKPIPPVYNLVLVMLWRHPEIIGDVAKVKVVHYCGTGGTKPWSFTGKEAHMDREDIKMLVNKWWDIYNDHTLDYNHHHQDQEGHVAN